MAKKKANKKAKFIIPALGIAALVTVLYFTSGQPFPTTNGDMWFLDDQFELAIAKNQVLACGGYGEMTQTFTDGQKQAFGTKQTKTFDVFKLDILSLRAGKSIQKLDANLNAFCDKVNGVTSVKLVGGTIKTDVYFRDDSGSKILVKSSSTNLPTVERDFSSPKALPAILIDISELKNKISTTKPQITGPLTVEINADLKLKTNFGTHTGKFSVSLGDWLKVTNDKIVNPKPGTQPSQATTSARMEITKILWNNYPTSEIVFEAGRGTHTISVKAELERWSTQEGVPYLVVLDPAGKILYSKIPMTSSIKKAVVNGKESADTYEFTASNIIIKNVAGKYELQLHSANDIRKSGSGKALISVKEFAVKVNAPVPKKPTDTCNDTSACCADLNHDGKCDSSTGPTITEEKASKVDGFFKCEIIFDGGKENCVVGQTPTFPVTFPDSPMSFIRTDDSKEKTLVELWIEPVLDFKGSRVDSVSNMKLKQNFNVFVNDADAGIIQTNSATVGKINGQYLTISRVSILASSLESQIQKNGITLETGDTIKIQFTVDGGFDATLNGKKMKGLIQGMTYEYALTYKQKEDLSCPDGQVRENNICVDGNLGKGSGGTCEGLTSEECAAQGKTGGGSDGGTGGNDGSLGGVIDGIIETISGGSSSGSGGLKEKEKPTAKPGINGVCDEDVADCSTLLDQLGGQGTFIILVIFIMFVFIIMIMVIIISVGKKKQ